MQLSVKGKLHLTVVSSIAYKKIFTLVFAPSGPCHGQQTGLVKKNVNKGREKTSESKAVLIRLANKIHPDGITPTFVILYKLREVVGFILQTLINLKFCKTYP